MKRVYMNQKYNIFSFFSGAGFLDLGFELSGSFNVVYVNEFHKAFNDVYRYARQKMNIEPPRYGHHVEDITKILESDQFKVLKSQVEESKKETLTGIIGGPPCPDFSVAGKNKGKEGENGKLSGTYISLICETKPDFFLFENVKGLYRTAKHREFFEQLKAKLEKTGYLMTEQLINSIEFGAPQDRDRIILIGFRKDIAGILHLPNDGKFLIGFDWDKNKLYSREALTLPWPKKSPYKEDIPTEIPEGLIKELTVQYWWEKNDVLNHPNASMYFQPRAGLYRFQTKDEGDDEKKCYKRLHRWRYSPTVAYGNNEVHIHPYKPRRISVAEALALQSLPKEFELPTTMTLTDAFKTIGNGVPYMAALGIAKNIIDYISNNNK
ncbi:MAG: DNA cytosine methyltransferase [Muribaculaceae bacterium]|nr:DNA cytosine methyltransferase [Muribaculaceae bacterium]